MAGRAFDASASVRYHRNVGMLRRTLAVVVALGSATIASLGACGLSLVGESPPTGVDSAADVLPDGGPGPTAPDGSSPTTPDGAICQGAVCDGTCVDTSTDALHCGACSSPCPNGQVCSNGACMMPCPGKEVACNGACCAGVCAANACKLPELWLRADEGVTSSPPFVWADQSGKGRNVEQSEAALTPTVVANELAGRPVLRFSNGQRLRGPEVQGFQLGTGDLAWFHVARSRGNATDRNQVFGTIQNGNPFRGMTAGFGPADRPYGLLREGNGNGKEVFLRADTGSQEWGIIDLRRRSGVTELRRNGALVATASSNHDVSGGAVVVGAERTDGTEFLEGDIAEILVFGGGLSDAERASVTKYLSQRHAIVAQ